MSFSLLLFVALLETIAAEVRHTSGGGDFCIVDGRPYRNGERIPRDHVCHVCLCHLGKAECSWMKCPPPPEGCTEFTVSNYCNPTLYICNIPEDLIGSRKRRSHGRYKRAADMLPTELGNTRNTNGDCNVLGVPYRTGDLMGIATSFCLECRCGRGNMLCSPRCCFQHVTLNANVTDLLTAPPRQMVPQLHPLHHILK